jgi:hypothetical protein
MAHPPSGNRSINALRRHALLPTHFGANERQLVEFSDEAIQQ